MACVTQKGEYALALLVGLALLPIGGLTTIAELGAWRDVPLSVAPQLIGRLAARGWVKTLRGPCGGVALAVDPASVSVGEVLEAVGDRSRLRPCLEAAATCRSLASCAIRPLWQRAQSALDDVLYGTTVADVARSLDRRARAQSLRARANLGAAVGLTTGETAGRRRNRGL